MKNLFLILAVSIFFVNVSIAQKPNITGKWNLTKMQRGEEVKTVDSGVIFEENGITKLGFFNMEEIMEAGTWEYIPSDNSIQMNSDVEQSINGKAEIIEISENELVYKKEGVVYSFVRYPDEPQTTSRLNFTIDDFFDDNGDYKYYDDEENLPWQDLSEMVTSLTKVKQLVYLFSKENDETDDFEQMELIAEVASNVEEMTLNIDYIFYGYDRNNLPEDAALPPNTNYENLLYPEEENTFRIAGNEEITTPAGTFDCTIIEVCTQQESQKKLWMINDKPSIYAKIIEEKSGDFGHYYVYELQEIK
jgi:hypothetical protein